MHLHKSFILVDREVEKYEVVVNLLFFVDLDRLYMRFFPIGTGACCDEYVIFARFHVTHHLVQYTVAMSFATPHFYHTRQVSHSSQSVDFLLDPIARAGSVKVTLHSHKRNLPGIKLSQLPMRLLHTRMLVLHLQTDEIPCQSRCGT